ncbi:hypothetical protein JOE48_005728 [Methylobacterium sp. PvR107]|nr:hypothetical protein [Methylobacterium sp. PvR107]
MELLDRLRDVLRERLGRPPLQKDKAYGQPGQRLTDWGGDYEDAGADRGVDRESWPGEALRLSRDPDRRLQHIGGSGLTARRLNQRRWSECGAPLDLIQRTQRRPYLRDLRRLRRSKQGMDGLVGF